MEYAPWQYEYMYAVYPSMDTRATNDREHNAMLPEMDFESDQAKAFKMGWDAHKSLVSEGLKGIVNINDADDWGN